MSRIRRSAAVALLATSLAVSSAAKDLADLTHDLKTGEDFRLRSAAALALGKMKDRSVRGALEDALSSDKHAAVRAAAASALGALGDPLALDALRRAASGDSNDSVRRAAESAAKKLDVKKKAPQVLVRLGAMKNGAGVGGAKVEAVLLSATRDRAERLSGVEVISGGDQRKLPVVVLEGTVARLAESGEGGGVTVSAEVKYVVKRASALKVSVSGRARAEGPGADPPSLQALREAAVAAAVDSALKDSAALLAAAK